MLFIMASLRVTRSARRAASNFKNRSFRRFEDSQIVEIALRDAIAFNGLNGAQRLNDWNGLQNFIAVE